MNGIKKKLHIDIETYSDVDLKKCGVYRYVDSPSFTILLFGYAYDDDEVKVIDLTKEELSQEIIEDLSNPAILKIAHNANFERTCLTKYLKTYMEPEQWMCTAVWASYLGLPRSLDEVGKVLGLEEDEKKSKTGIFLINYFSKPCKSTTKNNGRTRNLPEHDLEKWQLYMDYNKQDVIAERSIEKKLNMYPNVPKHEWEHWATDQKINERGVLIDEKLVENILEYSENHTLNLISEAREMGIENPKSVPQSIKFLKNNGYDVDKVDKQSLANLKEEVNDEDKNVKKFLKIKSELGKTSVSKYEAMQRAMCNDRRVRGILQFYGANRTGRWAGRIIQPQNLPKNKISDLDFARNLILKKEFELAEICYPSIMDLFSQLIRTAIIAEENKTFIVADYSAIEARVLAWLAGEKWVIEVFKTHGKIYEAAASKMYHVPIEEIKHGSDLRAKGKIATLACGYQGGIGALNAMDFKNEIPEPEKKKVIDDWRMANRNIVAFWKEMQEKTIRAVENLGLMESAANGKIKIKMIKDTLFIQLPSKRLLAYKQMTYDKKERRLIYKGLDVTNKWGNVETYGGKLVENITQAVARDILAEAILNLKKQGYDVQFHVHDEVIVEVKKEDREKELARIVELMSLKNLSWIDDDLPLKAEAYTVDYYMKD